MRNEPLLTGQWTRTAAALCLAMWVPGLSPAAADDAHLVDAYEQRLSSAVALERAGHSVQAALTAAQAAQALATAEEQRSAARRGQRGMLIYPSASERREQRVAVVDPASVAWRAAAAARALAAAERRRAAGGHHSRWAEGVGDPVLVALRRSALAAFREVAQGLRSAPEADASAASVGYGHTPMPVGSAHRDRASSSVRF